MNDTGRVPLPGFVVLEGIDGSGTTTQLRRIEDRLSALALPHWTSFEPSDLPTGRLIRRVLAGEITVDPGTLAHLYAADRHEHLHGRGGALERLGRGELVVFDRYLFSSLAYQGMACGPELPGLLNARFPLPELLLYLDIDVETAMARVERRAERDIFETREVQRRVREAYETTMAAFAGSPMRVARIDASAALEAVSGRVDEELDAVLARFHRR